MVAETIIFKQNRQPRLLKTKENSFVSLHHLMFSAKLAGEFLRLIAKTLKLRDRYVDKEHIRIRKISIHRSPPSAPALVRFFCLHGMHVVLRLGAAFAELFHAVDTKPAAWTNCPHHGGQGSVACIADIPW